MRTDDRQPHLGDAFAHAREDLLADFLDKQRRVAAALGTEIPESESVVQRVLAGEPASPSPTGQGG